MGRRSDSGASYKMVLVVREELRLTAGKAAVQVAHAAVLLAEGARAKHPEVYRAWMDSGGKKIALLAPNLTEMELIARKARASGVPAVFIEDAGLTEVAPGTKTVIGL